MMQVHEPNNIKFMAGFKRHEPVIMDSTAMMEYKACPRRYFFRMVLGFAPKETAEYLAFGSAYHKYREVLQRSLDVDQKQAGEAHIIAVETALKMYPNNPSPDSKWEFLSRGRLEQSCQVALKHMLKERIDGHIRVIAFEQPFTLQLGDVYVAGRADQIINWRGKIWGRDFKTSSKNGPFYSRSLEPNDQFTRYTWAESKLTNTEVQGQYIELLFNSKKEGPTIEPHTTTRTKGQIDRWINEHGFWIDSINRSRDQDNYPMNEKACTFCPFHSVCKASTESGMMSQLKSYFKVTPWDCTKTPDE